MSEHTFEVEGTSASAGTVFARLLEGDPNFRLSGDSILGDRPLKGMTVPRALDSQGRQRQDLFGFYLVEPKDVTYFQPGNRVVLATVERSRELDSLVVLDQALLELRGLALLLWPKGGGDLLTAFDDEENWVPRLGGDSTDQRQAIEAIREIRDALVHGIEPAARLAGFSKIEDYVRRRIASNLKPLRDLRVSLGRAA